MAKETRPADLTFATDDLFNYISTLGDWDSTDKPALLCSTTGRTIKYNELRGLILAVSASLRGLGFDAGEVLSVHLHNCIEYVLAFLGCAALGGITSPSNPMYEKNDLSHQLTNSGAVVCITSEKYKAVLEGAETSAVRHLTYIEDPTCFVHATAPPAGATPLPACGMRPDPKSLLALPYSSGTTGKAKGVMLNHQSVVCNILQSTEDADIRFEITKDDADEYQQNAFAVVLIVAIAACLVLSVASIVLSTECLRDRAAACCAGRAENGDEAGGKVEESRTAVVPAPSRSGSDAV